MTMEQRNTLRFHIRQLKCIQEHLIHSARSYRDDTFSMDVVLLGNATSFLEYLDKGSPLSLDELNSLDGIPVFAVYQAGGSNHEGYWCICNRGTLITPSQMSITVTKDLIRSGWNYYLMKDE